MSNTDRFTLAQARALFNVTSMTLYLWRRGTSTKAALPTEKPRAKLGELATAVLFDPAKLVKWADKHEVPLAMTVAQVTKMASSETSTKRGPKARKPAAKAVAKAAPAAKPAKRAPRKTATAEAAPA